MAASKRTPPTDLERHFEGPARLQALLEKAGVLADVGDVTAAFRTAQKDHVPSATVISALFEDEPQFPSPKEARALFGNLLGLWDLLESGGAPAAKGPRPKPPPPAPPVFFPKEGPDDVWVEGAWRWLEKAPKKELQRLQHAFDHRTDSLVTWLDEQALSELGFALSRHLFFELFAMLELGSSKGVGAAVAPLSGDAGEAVVPPALAAYAEEAVFEAEQDEEDPLPSDEARRIRSLVGQGLTALWKARKD